MTREKELLRLLRCYGPCPFRTLVGKSKEGTAGRDSLWSAMGRLRAKYWAEKCAKETYRLTHLGQMQIGNERPEERQRTFDEL